MGSYQWRPSSHFVQHSFVCTCRDSRHHFETIHGDDSVNGLGYLSWLSEPAFLQFQGKIWATVNTPKHCIVLNKVVSRLCISDSCFLFVFFFFHVTFPRPVTSVFYVVYVWVAVLKPETLTSVFSALILLMRFSCGPG